MQFMVTQRMKAELAALGYSEAEAQILDPQRAAAIIEHSIRRPSRGVPASWNRAAAAPGPRGAAAAAGAPAPVPGPLPAGGSTTGGTHRFGPHRPGPGSAASHVRLPMPAPASFPFPQLFIDRRVGGCVSGLGYR